MTDKLGQRKVAIIQGHPDAARKHLCHALADAYAKGAEEAGHQVRRVEVAMLDFAFLRSKHAYEETDLPPALEPAQQAIGWADHLVFVYPLWMGTMPAMLKAFLEQAFRPGFAFSMVGGSGMGRKLLKGKSARVVVTMGMSVFLYRWYFRAHSVKSFERNILGFCGIGPISESLFGGVEGADEPKRLAWLVKMRVLGRTAR